MAFAAPIVRDQFLYNGGDLFVDVGNLNRHKRAAVAEIRALLRPDLKKSKSTGEQGKDQVAHWYEAQCIHYGLPPSKDKARAKLRLLEALNTSKLDVPAHLISLESEMKKEFTAAERKAKAQHKAALGGVAAKEAPPANKKRKASETIGLVDRSEDKISSTNATDRVIKTTGKQQEKKPIGSGPEKPAERPKQYARSSKLTNAWIERYQQGLPHPGPPPKDYHVGMDGRLYSNIDGSEPSFMIGVKRQSDGRQGQPDAGKDGRSQQQGTRPTATGLNKPAERKKQTARAPHLVKAFIERYEQGLPPPGPPPVGCHIGSDGRVYVDADGSEVSWMRGVKRKAEPEQDVVKAGKDNQSKQHPGLSKKAGTAKELAAKKERNIKTDPSIKKEPGVKKEPKVKKEPTSKAELKIKRETSPTAPSPSKYPPLGFINGVYDISCPEISEQWGYSDLTLVLTLDTPVVWGAYDFGTFSGILRLPSRPTVASGTALPFHWRGREGEEGEMSFGDSCEGALYFRGGGKISGHMNLCGDVEFDGQRRQGPGTAIRNAASMKHEWEEYNEDAYEDERVGRW